MINVKTNKRLWNVFNILALLWTVFYLPCLFYFNLKYGWHLEPITKEELVIFSLLDAVYNIAFIIFVVVSYNVIDYLLTDEKKYQQ